jgi:hypothetical protein
MERYGATIVHDDDGELAAQERVEPRFVALLQPPFRNLTALVVLLGLGIGLVYFGFQLWIPSNLRELGFTEDNLTTPGGSDALVDALVAWGDVDTVVGRVREHLDAGADHVAVQVLPAEKRGVPDEHWRLLAEPLTAFRSPPRTPPSTS